MRKLLLLLIVLASKSISFAQNQDDIIENRPLKGFYFNFLGDASLVSVNFERLSIANPKTILSTKVGVGYNEEFNICFAHASDLRQ